MRAILQDPREIERVANKLREINSMFAKYRADVFEKATIKKWDSNTGFTYDDNTVKAITFINEQQTLFINSDSEIMEMSKEGIF